MRPLPTLLTLAALAMAAAPAAAQVKGATTKADLAKLEEAKKHMKAGAAFYNDPAGHKCEEALREFGKAFELSGSLNALKGMAVCSLELEHDGDAIEQYSAYLTGKGASIDPTEKTQIEADLNALKEAVARVKLSADKPGVRIVDIRTPAKGLPVTNSYTLSDKPLGVHPGQHVFTASVEGQPDVTWKIEITNGGSYEHVFEFSKPKTEEPVAPPPTRTTRPISLPVYIAGGATVAAMVPWVALMVRAKSKNDAYDAANHKETASQLATLRDDVKSANLVADVFLGVTAAGVVTTTVLFLTRPSKTEPAPKTGSVTFAPLVGPSGAGATLVGSF